MLKKSKNYRFQILYWKYSIAKKSSCEMLHVTQQLRLFLTLSAMEIKMNCAVDLAICTSLITLHPVWNEQNVCLEDTRILYSFIKKLLVGFRRETQMNAHAWGKSRQNIVFKYFLCDSQPVRMKQSYAIHSISLLWGCWWKQ